MHRFIPVSCVAVLMVATAACDSGPGPGDLSLRPPLVSDLRFSPASLSSAGSGDGETVSAELTVHLSAADPDGDLETVFVVVQSPVPGDAPVGSAELSAAAGGRYEAQLQLTLPRGLAGTFPVVGFASDATGRISNRSVGTLIVEAGAEPPVIDQIDMPDTVTRPAAGDPPVPVQIVAHVSDPDGLENILRVESVVNGSSTWLLCDDGGSGTCNPGFGSSGDQTAGDGLFTLTIQIASSNAAADNEFVFTAFDRSGLSSESVTRVITVQ